MAILNYNFSGPAESNVFHLGSFIPIWAEVDQQAHQPLVLLLEECVASTTLEMYPDTLTYPLITNEGCLVEGKKTFSRFLPRYHSSSILLHLQAFRFAVGEEVYIHCKLIAWDPDDLNESRKACNYDKTTEAPQGWTPFFQSPAQGYGELSFHMAILNYNFSGPAESSVFPLDSFIPIWAEVDQQAHQPLVLLLEECVASTTLEMYPDTLTYPLITNEGCLVEGKNTISRFLPRYHSSSILLHLQAFRFAVGEEMYIHCKLIAWDPDDLNESRKACNYDKTTEEWELLDDPKMNHLCQCCDSTCKGRPKRDAESATTVDCGKNSVSVRWTETNLQVDPYSLQLGDCPPSQVSVKPEGVEAVFNAEFGACTIRRLVTRDKIVFATEITSTASLKASPVFYPVACAYKRPKDWAPPLYNPLVFHTHGQGDLNFHMTLMRDDFSGLATSTTFSLGSTIPIAASVEQQSHQPLMLLLEECVASTTPELGPDSRIYPLITNKGEATLTSLGVSDRSFRENCNLPVWWSGGSRAFRKDGHSPDR
ncbi:hypothetical protein E1301_Tti016008 [Triplophysa tibetana]|uniref:ZP domain-containing protein n=1 Tax=Triplophysa tibetana TaxID=1572043 RepID=A0A5A9PEC6_9TELE|nr:hypothetical protein E1301_Tti016008 [Triplophysa tibetana]